MFLGGIVGCNRVYRSEGIWMLVGMAAFWICRMVAIAASWDCQGWSDELSSGGSWVLFCEQNSLNIPLGDTCKASFPYGCAFENEWVFDRYASLSDGYLWRARELLSLKLFLQLCSSQTCGLSPECVRHVNRQRRSLYKALVALNLLTSERSSGIHGISRLLSNSMQSLTFHWCGCDYVDLDQSDGLK